MSETRPAAASSSDSGVVDPLRVTGAAWARHTWAGLPQLSRSFVALAAIDVVVRALGLFDTRLGFAVDNPLSWFSAFLPHDALILLPAILLARRPDALESTPLIV